MTPASEKIPDLVPPCSDNSVEGRVVPQCPALQGGFLWQQLSAAGLAAVAEKVAAGCDMDLEDALLLSRASLPLLGKMVQLRPAAGGARDAAVPAALPIERAASLLESPRGVGQVPAGWESFCRTLISTRGEVCSSGPAIFWYPNVGQSLDRDLGCDGNITGVDVLRAIALARLVLPAEVEVRAPLAMLGPKLAQVALDFGAGHLGYVAPDGQTPNDPLIADPSLLDELVGSCLPTPLA